MDSANTCKILRQWSTKITGSEERIAKRKGTCSSWSISLEIIFAKYILMSEISDFAGVFLYYDQRDQYDLFAKQAICNFHFLKLKIAS